MCDNCLGCSKAARTNLFNLEFSKKRLLLKMVWNIDMADVRITTKKTDKVGYH
jgi:hypothetical protein